MSSEEITRLIIADSYSRTCTFIYRIVPIQLITSPENSHAFRCLQIPWIPTRKTISQVVGTVSFWTKPKSLNKQTSIHSRIVGLTIKLFQLSGRTKFLHTLQTQKQSLKTWRVDSASRLHTRQNGSVILVGKTERVWEKKKENNTEFPKHGPLEY